MKKVIILIYILFSTLFVEAQTTSGEYAILNLKVNSKNSDSGLTFFGEDKIVFSALEKHSKTEKLNNEQFLDLYIGTLSEEYQILDKEKIKGSINTKFNETGVAFSKNFKTLYFTRNSSYEKKEIQNFKKMSGLSIYKATINGEGEWGNITPMPFNNKKYSVGYPTLSKDGKKLYFISDMPGGFGKTDIYVVDILEKGSYSEPRNLGEKVNSAGTEFTPYISEDNILYFSSDGRDGYGKFDIYASKIFKNTVTKAINLEKPINSEADDFSFVINNSIDSGFFSSNRGEGKGNDDIYSFIILQEMYVHCTQVIKGTITSESSGKLLPGAIVELRDQTGKEIESTTAKEEDASYVFKKALCNSKYIVTVIYKGYLDNEVAVSTANDFGAEAMILDLSLPDQFVFNRININNIYFDLDKYSIRPEAAKELDRVVQVMMEYPTLTIEAGSHTDSRAPDAYNMKLSNKRAKSTVDYLISKGIDAGRLTYKGYGETQLIEKCADQNDCSEEIHQLNRRTEFVITNEGEFE